MSGEPELGEAVQVTLGRSHRLGVANLLNHYCAGHDAKNNKDKTEAGPHQARQVKQYHRNEPTEERKGCEAVALDRNNAWY